MERKSAIRPSYLTHKNKTKQLNEADEKSLARKIGKDIFGGCLTDMDFDPVKDNFGTWFLSKQCNSIEDSSIKKLLNMPFKLDSIQMEKGRLIVNFWRK